MNIVLKPFGALLVLLALLGCFAAVFIMANRQPAQVSALTPSGSVSGAPQARNVPASPATPSSVRVENGSFSDGTKLPTGWTNLPWIGKGAARLERDTKTFKSAPAALRLEGVTEDSYVALDHLLPGFKEGDTFRVSGWVKFEGTVKDAQLAIRGRETEGATAPQKEYVPITSVTNATEWTPFEKTITLGPGNKHAYLVLVLAGKGKLWIDDLEVTK